MSTDGDVHRTVLGRVLGAALPERHRAEVLGDLEERYRVRLRASGPRAARDWYRRQARSLIVWGMRRRLEILRSGHERRGVAGVRAGAGSWVSGMGRDVRHAARALKANPGYAGVAIITLALGIGGNTAVFSVVDGVLLRPLPFHEPTELVAIHETRLGQSWWSASPSNVLAWRERSRTLDDVAWARPRQVGVLDGEGNAVPVPAIETSWNVFDLLEVAPARGRFFLEHEDRVGAAPVVVLTHDFWIEHYGGAPDAVGGRLIVDGVPHTVVGVAPPGREPAFFGDHEVLLPKILTEAEIQSQGRILRTVGRIADGVELSAAREEMSVLGAELDAEAAGGSARGWGVRLVPLKDEMVGSVRAPLLVLLGAVGFVLLVACANLSNLMLARGSARTGDMAVRASLGAGRGRLVRHLLAEALLVSAVGGALGLVLLPRERA